MTYREFISDNSEIYVPLGFLRHKMKDNRYPVQSSSTNLDFGGCDAYWCFKVLDVIGKFILALNIAEMREPRPEVDAFIGKWSMRALNTVNRSIEINEEDFKRRTKNENKNV